MTEHRGTLQYVLLNRTLILYSPCVLYYLTATTCSILSHDFYSSCCPVFIIIANWFIFRRKSNGMARRNMRMHFGRRGCRKTFFFSNKFIGNKIIPITYKSPKNAMKMYRVISKSRRIFFFSLSKRPCKWIVTESDQSQYKNYHFLSHDNNMVYFVFLQRNGGLKPLLRNTLFCPRFSVWREKKSFKKKNSQKNVANEGIQAYCFVSSKKWRP